MNFGLSPRCGDNLEAHACCDGEIVVTALRQFVSAVRRHPGADTNNPGIVHAVGAQSLRAVLSLAPGFSQVSDARRIKKPFQRFLCAGGKPLKRFTGRTSANTRLKPGANETNRNGIHFASYVTKLIPKKLLEQKFHEAVRMARARLIESKKD